MLKRLLLLLLSSILLCGCTAKTDVTTVSFASWGSITEVEIINKIISDFEKENPEIRIQFMHVPQNYFQKLHLLFASNSAPDVLFVNNLYLPVYESYLEDLGKYVQKKDYYPQALEGLNFNKKQLAVPRDISNLVFYVNTDMLKLDTKLSLKEMLDYGAQLKQKNIWFTGIEEDIYWAQPYLAYYGEIFDESFGGQNSKGFTFYKDLRDRYGYAPSKAQVGSSTLAQMFLDGKIAVYLSGRWMFPKIKEQAEFNWQIVAFPEGVAKQPCDVSGWAISKSSKNKAAALKFVEYISSEKNAQYFAQTGLVVPARVEASKILDNSEHSEKVFLDVIDLSKNTLVTKDYKKLVDKFNRNNF